MTVEDKENKLIFCEGQTLSNRSSGSSNISDNIIDFGTMEFKNREDGETVTGAKMADLGTNDAKGTGQSFFRNRSSLDLEKLPVKFHRRGDLKQIQNPKHEDASGLILVGPPDWFTTRDASEGAEISYIEIAKRITIKEPSGKRRRLSLVIAYEKKGKELPPDFIQEGHTSLNENLVKDNWVYCESPVGYLKTSVQKDVNKKYKTEYAPPEDVPIIERWKHNNKAIMALVDAALSLGDWQNHEKERLIERKRIFKEFKEMFFRLPTDEAYHIIEQKIREKGFTGEIKTKGPLKDIRNNIDEFLNMADTKVISDGMTLKKISHDRLFADNKMSKKFYEAKQYFNEHRLELKSFRHTCIEIFGMCQQEYDRERKRYERATNN